MTLYAVSSVTELYSALKLAVGGDRIELAAGHYDYIELKNSYSSVGLSGQLNYDSPVLITSADANNPATIGRIDMRYSNNISFDNFIFNGDNSNSDTDYGILFNVANSSNISITNSELAGNAEGYAATTDDFGNNGINVRDSSGITVSGNDIHNFTFGTSFLNVSDLVITDNNLHDIQGDFMRLPGTVNGVIANNTFSNHLSSDHNINHADYIQFWTNAQTRGAENVTISGNTFLNGDYYAQAIFMRNEYNDTTGGAHPEDHYKNITIEDNVIYNGHHHGVTIGYVDGIVVRNNTFIDDDTFSSGQDNGMAPSINISYGTGVEVYNNVVPGSVNISNSKVLVNEGNFFTNDVNEFASNYTGKLFLNSFDGRSLTLEDLMIHPDSPLVKADGSVYGSSRLIIDSNPADLTALIVREGVLSLGPNVFEFNAGLSANANGFLGAQDARYIWDFGDGTTAEGFVVQHTYATVGDHSVTLTVLHKDGTTDTAQTLAAVKDPLLVDLDFTANGIIDVSSYASTLGNAGTSLLNLNGDLAYRLQDKQRVEVTRNNQQLFSHDQMTLDFTIARDSATTGGGIILTIHSSWDLSMSSDGTLLFTMTNADGATFKVASEKGAISDTAEHRVVLSYDSYTKTATFYVDGVNVGSGHMEGVTQPFESWGLYIGNPWGINADVALSDFKMYGDALSQDEVLNGYTLAPEAVSEVIVPGYADSEVPEEVILEEETSGGNVSEGAEEEVPNAPSHMTLDQLAAHVHNMPLDMNGKVVGFQTTNGDDSMGAAWKLDAVKADRYDAELFVDGQDGDDKLTGWKNDDVIFGGAGNDKISANDGNDIVFGGAGDDSIEAFGNGYGKNIMSGGDGNDVVSGSNDKDILLGDDGDDRLLGRAGDDILIGGAGKDYLQGGEGDDVLYGGAGKDTYQGGAGHDIFVFSHLGEADSIFDFELGHDKFNVGQLLDELNLSVSPDEILDVFSVKVTNEYWGRADFLMNVNGEDHVIAHFSGEGVGQLTMQALIDTNTIMLDAFTVNPEIL